MFVIIIKHRYTTIQSRQQLLDSGVSENEVDAILQQIELETKQEAILDVKHRIEEKLKDYAETSRHATFKK